MPTNKCRRRRRGWALAALLAAQELLNQQAAVGGRGRGRGRGGRRGGRDHGRGGGRVGRGGGPAGHVGQGQAAVPPAGAPPGRGRGGGRGGGPAGHEGQDQAALPPDDAPDLNLSESDLVQLFKKCNEAEKLLRAMIENNKMPVQRSLDDVPCIFVDMELEHDELDRFYDKCTHWYASNYPFRIPVFLEDGTVVYIRLTPKKEPTVELRTHHIVVMVRKADNAHAEILIENYSGYAVAFRVVYDGENRDDIIWSFVGDEDLDTNRYKFKRTGYKSAYNFITRIYFGEKAGQNIFSFIESFRADAVVDEEADEDKPGGEADATDKEVGHQESDDEVGLKESDAAVSPKRGAAKWLDLIYAVFCEGRRFSMVRRWASGERGPFPPWFPDVVHDWSSLGKCVQLLYLYLLEAMLAYQEGETGWMLELSEESKESALDWWNSRQVALASALEFYKEEVEKDKQKVPPMLRQLACSELTLIKTEEDIWDHICLRILKYDGPWNDEISRRSEARERTSDQGVVVASKQRLLPAEVLLLLADPDVVLLGTDEEDWWHYFENEWCWQQDKMNLFNADDMFYKGFLGLFWGLRDEQDEEDEDV